MSDETAGVVIFALTYVLVCARRMGWLGLDRPGAALLGASACVLAGVLSAEQAVAAIDGRTILLLAGMMGMGAFLAADGFFDRAAVWLARTARTPSRLLAALVWSAGGLSALVTNDAVCVLGAPLVVELVRRYRLPALPYLLALATAANTGSVATLVGNPQNMLCASLGHLAYRDHLMLVGPVAVVSLVVNHAVLRLLFGKDLRGRLPIEHEDSGPVVTRRTAALFAVVCATVLGYLAGADLAWTSVAGCAVMFVVVRPRSPEQIWQRVDWSVLLFFAGLFVVVEAFVRTGVPALFFTVFPLEQGTGLASWLRLSAIFLFGSNIVSNVPFILVVREQMSSLPDPRLGWELLAVASTFAGNLTLLGSVANIIVAEKASGVGGVGFLSYLRAGAPVALLTTLVGSVMMWWMAG